MEDVTHSPANCEAGTWRRIPLLSGALSFPGREETWRALGPYPAQNTLASGPLSRCHVLLVTLANFALVRGYVEKERNFPCSADLSSLCAYWLGDRTQTHIHRNSHSITKRYPASKHQHMFGEHRRDFSSFVGGDDCGCRER